MEAFKPMNLAQLYHGADAAVAQAMQTNLLAMQTTRLKREYDEEDALRNLASKHFAPDPITGEVTGDLRSFSKAAMGVAPLKAPAYAKMADEAAKTALERENLQGQIDERRMKGAADRLKLMNEASTVPYMKWKELTDGGMPDQEARAQVQPLYVQAIRNLASSGMFTREQMSKFTIPEQFDPSVAEVGMRQVLGAKESLAQYWNERNFKLNKDKFEFQVAESNQPKYEVKDAGGELVLYQTNPKAGAVGPVQNAPTLKKTMSPSERDASVRGWKSLTQGQLELDEERGVIVNKVTRETFSLAGPGGAPLPPKSGSVEGLRKEFNAREEVKAYNAAVPVLRSISSAADTPAGDLDFIYGVGKILDPTSVVREGEMALVIKSGSPLERVLGTTNWVTGEGKLTPKLRGQLLGMLHGRVSELQKAALDARKPYEEQAKRQNIPVNETLTLPELPKLPDRRGAPTRTGNEIPSFSTEADAQAAARAGRIKVGDRIKIGDQTGVWQ
jgi:hypothetical protein